MEKVFRSPKSILLRDDTAPTIQIASFIFHTFLRTPPRNNENRNSTIRDPCCSDESPKSDCTTLSLCPEGERPRANRSGQRSSNDFAQRLQLPSPRSRLHLSYPFQYVLLMSEAILVFAGDSVLTKFLSRGAKRHLHWILQILGLILIVSGVVLMCRVKPVHFKSVHGILGITSTVLAVFLSVAGYPVFIAAKLRSAIKPVAIKFAHNFLGISCFAIGMAAQCYGYTYIFKSDLKFLFITIVVAIIALSIRRAVPSLFRQFVGLFK